MTASPDAIHVLHVDDDPELSDLVATYLERVNARLSVQTAVSPAEALDRLETADVDCVVSDYDMPESDGIEFLEAVREVHPDLPFVLYTGKGSEEVASDAISAGATDYLRKQSGSENYELLANRIVNAVEKTRSEGRATRYKRIAELVRTIQSALVRATTTEEIDTAVCETLAAADPYEFVWIGDVDPGSGAIRPRALAGRDADTEDFRFEQVEADAAGPIAEALEEQSVVLPGENGSGPARVVGNSVHDYASIAVVPLVYDDAEYGVLTLYAQPTNTFGREERELLGELGETVAHAINRVSLQRQYEDQYRELFEDAPVMFAFTRIEDGELLIEECNRQFAETLGYSAAELRGRQVAELYTDESRRKLQEGGYERALAGDFLAEERDLLTRDGERVSTVLRASPRRNGEGDIIGTNSLYVDVTHREQMESVSQRRRQLRQIIDLIPDNIFAKDRDGKFILANEAIAELYGSTPQDMVGKTDFDFLDEEAAKTYRQDDQKVIESNQQMYFPVEEVTDADGETHIWETRKMPLTLAGSETDGVLGYARDITDLKQRERVLREMYRLISDTESSFEEKVDGLLDVGTEALDLRYANFATVQDDEYMVSVARSPNGEITDGDVLPREATVCDRIVRTGDSLAIEDIDAEDQVQRDRVTAPVEDITSYIGTPVSLDDDDPVLVCFYDTEAREEEFSEWDRTLVDLIGQWLSYERSRERLTADLARKNERLEEFAGILSHDLRNPLNVAAGRLELVRDEYDSEHLEEVARALDRMDGLIDDVLSLARDGSAVVEFGPVALSEVAERGWQHVETTGATLEVTTDAAVEADEGSLQRAFENLFRNAVEHGLPINSRGPDQDGQDANAEAVTVRVGTRENGFYVADDGPGIPESEREEVFEAGYSTRADNSGFGLSIVADVADAHGWTVDVTSSEAGGTRFEFTGVEEA